MSARLAAGVPGGCTRVLENYDFDRFQKLLRHNQAAEAVARAAAGVADDVGVADLQVEYIVYGDPGVHAGYCGGGLALCGGAGEGRGTDCDALLGPRVVVGGVLVGCGEDRVGGEDEFLVDHFACFGGVIWGKM